MTRYLITITVVLLAAATTGYAAQDNPDAVVDAPANGAQTQSVTAANNNDNAAGTQTKSQQKNPSFWDKTGAAIANTGNAAMDMGGKAWDSASDTASAVGDKAVDIGHSAMDTTSDVITTVSDSVTGALGMDSKKAASAPDGNSSNGRDNPKQTPQMQPSTQPTQDQN